MCSENILRLKLPDWLKRPPPPSAAITRAHLSSGMMSPPIPLMGVWLPDEETQAYVADTAVPNVQGVQG